MLHGTEVLSVLQAFRAATLWRKSAMAKDVEAWRSGNLGTGEETSTEGSQNQGADKTMGTWKTKSYDVMKNGNNITMTANTIH